MSTFIRVPIRTFALIIICVVDVSADVTDSSAAGFTSVNTVSVAAAPSTVYDLLIQDVAAWWDPEHTWTGDARNLSIDPQAGGLFREEIPGKGSAMHMEVVYADRGSLLRMRGGLGPLQGMAVTGSLTWAMKEHQNGTELSLTYTVTGYMSGGIAGLSVPVDGVLKHQLLRLKRYIETGKP